MIVVFRRTGPRRYAVEAKRESFPDLEMNPAPGYDPFMPHDLMHLVVEAQLGLSRGVFGQLAAGGDAGTFRPTFKTSETSRQIARVRKRVKARGTKLLKEGQDDSAQSERATFICWNEWLARSKASAKRDVNPGSKRRALDERKLNEICEHLDELSSRWSSLKVGQSMAVSWPDLAVTSDI